VGIHDDFFDIGGHSLKAVTLLTRLGQELGLAGLTQLDFYQAPTIDGIVQALGRGVSAAPERVPLLAQGSCDDAANACLLTLCRRVGVRFPSARRCAVPPRRRAGRARYLDPRQRTRRRC